MSESPVPYSMRPKTTRLPSGPDETLVPTFPPTDAERRTVAPIFWPAVDASKGPKGPPDAPLAPPPTDPARRSLPPFEWPKGLPGRVANRTLRETVSPVPALDPDIALWPAVVVSIWPFTGPPDEGIWPTGWFGIDNTGTPYVCTAGGEPGTWEAVGSGGGSGWPSVNGSGAGNLTAETGSGDTVGYNMIDQGSGGIHIETMSSDPGLLLLNSGEGAAKLQSDTGGATVNGAGGVYLNYTAGTSHIFLGAEEDATTIVPGAAGFTDVLANDSGNLTSDYDLTTGLATFLSTDSLSVGTWLIMMKGNWDNADGGNIIQAVVAEGTATATFPGGGVAAELASTASQVRCDFSICCFAAITNAGTLDFKAITNTTTDTPKIFAQGDGAYGIVTGYTAVRIA